VNNAIKILEAFGKTKLIIEDFEKRMSAGNKKYVPNAAEAKWLAEMTSLMIALRDAYIRESNLKVSELEQIFEISNQRIYQIRGKREKKAA
jgi:hypothetical protein